MSVNVKEVDTRHKELVDLINLLHDSVKSGEGKDVMGKVLNDLTDYTVYHFGTEERLFQKYGYIEYPQHKQEHDDLTKQVLDVRSKFEAGQTTITIEEMDLQKDRSNTRIKQSLRRTARFSIRRG